MIKLENLVKKFGNFIAVNNINLEIPSGELFCFLGPNGAGKTTTIKMLTGLMQPTAGRMEICGYDVTKAPLKAKRMIGYIPDMPYVYERLTPIEFMQFIGDLYQIPQKEIDERTELYFETFGLLEHRNSLIQSFSHGMRQRLIYSAAFLHHPQVLFIDEPLIALDPYTIRLIKDLLRHKVDHGMSIFLTTHILALAEDVADRIGIIMNGDITALGKKSELIQSHTGETLEDVFLRITQEESKKDLSSTAHPHNAAH